MNFLAHLHLADAAGLPLSGAVLGDLVRGRLEGRFPAPLAASLALHRRIDVATDAHEVARAARARFADGTRRYAGIVLDVLWDHCLARAWPGTEPLAAFATRAARELADTEHWRLAADQTPPSPARFERLLLSYRDAAGIEHALERLAARSSKPERLLAAAQGWPTRLPEPDAAFPQLYADLLALARAAAA